VKLNRHAAARSVLSKKALNDINNARAAGEVVVTVRLILMARYAAVGRCLRPLAFGACLPASPVSVYFG